MLHQPNSCIYFFFCANFTFLTRVLWSLAGPRILPTSVRLITSSQLRLRIVHPTGPSVSHHGDPEQHHHVPSLSSAQQRQPQWPILQFQRVVCVGLGWIAKHHTLHSNCTGPSGRRHFFWDTRARERESERGAHRHLSIFYLVSDRPRGDDDYQQRGETCIIAQVCFILYRVTKKKKKPTFPNGCDSLSVFLVYRCSFNGSYFSNWTLSAHITMKLYYNVEYRDPKGKLIVRY